MGIPGVAAVLSDICSAHFKVDAMNDAIRDWTGKLDLNFVATEDKRSHFDRRIVLDYFWSLCFVTT
jgi:hypothetical protein